MRRSQVRLDKCFLCNNVALAVGPAMPAATWEQLILTLPSSPVKEGTQLMELPAFPVSFHTEGASLVAPLCPLSPPANTEN